MNPMNPMNPILAKLFGDGVSGVGDAFAKIVGCFKLSPEKQAELMQLKEQNAQSLAVMDEQLKAKSMEYDQAVIAAASANIQAEARSGDKYTSRARPTFMYIVEFILAFNYIGIPLAKIFGSTLDPIALPGNLLTLFGVCVTGYVGARSLDKLLSLPGDSQLQLGPLKLGNKQS